jgi:hypothetical protein
MGDVNKVPLTVTVDTGCCTSLMNLSWFKKHRHIFFYPGSPCELMAFEQPPSLGVLLGGHRAKASYVLRNVPLGLGSGIYPVNFLLMECNFDVTLGLEFVSAYAARVQARVPHDRSRGAGLLIPTPPGYWKPGLAVPLRPAWAQGDSPKAATWLPTNFVPGRYVLTRQRFAVTPVDPSALPATA